MAAAGPAEVALEEPVRRDSLALPIPIVVLILLVMLVMLGSLIMAVLLRRVRHPRATLSGGR
jgi:hypothetical protein